MKKIPLITLIMFIFITEPLLANKKEKWPETLDAAVENILSTMSDKDKELVRKKQKRDLILFHHGWGTGIRNAFGLWRGNVKLLKSACGKICHPDSASMIIIEAVWQKLRE